MTFPSTYGLTKGEQSLKRKRKQHDVVLYILIATLSLTVLHILVIEPYQFPAEASAPVMLDDADYCRMWEAGKIELERVEQEGAVRDYCEQITE